MLTADRANEVFSDDGQSLLWMAPTARRNKRGQLAGTVRPDGYMQVCVDGKLYLAHRVLWLMRTGEWPVGEIDHINGDKTDNSPSNLREVSKSGNMQNIRRAFSSNSSTGLLGVSVEKKTGKFYARICVDGKQKTLGTFDSPKDAHVAYLDAKRMLHGTCSI
jgi:hypothetical protein